MFYFTSLYFQEIHHYSPLRSGFAFLPLPFAIVAGSTMSERVSRRFGVRALMVTGLLLDAAGLLLLTGLPVEGSYLTDVLLRIQDQPKDELAALLPLVSQGVTDTEAVARADVLDPGQCAGHFPECAVWPVALIMHSLGRVAGNLLHRRLNRDARYSVISAQVMFLVR